MLSGLFTVALLLLIGFYLLPKLTGYASVGDALKKLSVLQQLGLLAGGVLVMTLNAAAMRAPIRRLEPAPRIHCPASLYGRFQCNPGTLRNRCAIRHFVLMEGKRRGLHVSHFCGERLEQCRDDFHAGYCVSRHGGPGGLHL